MKEKCDNFLDNDRAQAEKALIKARGRSSWACVILKPGESQAEALQRYPEVDEAQTVLFINTSGTGQDVDKQIRETIEELLRAGVTRGEIDSIIAKSQKSTS